jgi:Family of unknown function (DUF6807)
MFYRKMFASGLVTSGAALLLIIIIGPVLSPRAFAESPYTLAPVEYGMQLKTPNGRVVFEYVTKKPEKIGLTSPSAAYFHPLNTPSGETVTNVAPDDHPHHRGIFLGFLESEFHSPGESSEAWPDHPDHPIKVFDIQRGDFWSWGFYAPRDGRVIQNRDIKLVRADAKRAQLEIHNEWLIENKKLIDETDEVTVSERDGVYVIDLAYRLAPVVDYVLKRQAFGGFAVQGQKAGEHYYSTASGKVTLPSPYYSVPDLDWPAEPWYDYTIHLASDGKVVGVAVLDHPLNPPTRWHNTVWLINPCITSFGDMTIHPDDPLILRYRVVVHDGPPPTEVLQKLSEEWRGMQSNPFVSQ